MSANKGEIPGIKSITNGILLPFVLVSLMLVSLLAAAPSSSSPRVGGTEGEWAAPGQDPQRQTVPTPPPPTVPKPETKVPPRSEPPPSALPTSTSTPLPLPTSTLPLPLPTVKPVLTTPMPVASPTAQLTLLPAPVGQTPTIAQMCQPLEKTISSLRDGELDLLVPCRILVQVPAGAVMEDTLLRLVPRLPTDAPPSEAWLQMRSVAFTMEALSPGGRPRPGFIFARPYTVTIRYNQTDVEIEGGKADSLTIAYYDAAARKWIPLHSQVDPKERLVSAEFDQPGWLALMISITEGQPTRRPVSTPIPPSSGTGPTTMAPTSVPSPSNQSEEAINPTCFLGIAGAPFLLALAVGLYVARRRRRKG